MFKTELDWQAQSHETRSFRQKHWFLPTERHCLYAKDSDWHLDYKELSVSSSTHIDCPYAVYCVEQRLCRQKQFKQKQRPFLPVRRVHTTLSGASSQWCITICCYGDGSESTMLGYWIVFYHSIFIWWWVDMFQRLVKVGVDVTFWK